MKHTLIITALVAVSAAVLTGCANAHKNDASTAVFKPAALATAHGIGTPNVTVTDTTTASNTVSVINVRYDWHDFVGTNIADPKPLAALDVRLRDGVIDLIARIHRQFDLPMILVSHAPDDVARLADHVVMLGQDPASAWSAPRTGTASEGCAG